MYHRACLDIKHNILRRPIEGVITKTEKQENIKKENIKKENMTNEQTPPLQIPPPRWGQTFEVKKEYIDHNKTQNTSQNTDQENNQNSVIIKTEGVDENESTPDYDISDDAIFGNPIPKRMKQ